MKEEEMAQYNDFNQKQLNAIHLYYSTISKKIDQKISLHDIVISWLTEGHAEKFREEYLKNNSILV